MSGLVCAFLAGPATAEPARGVLVMSASDSSHERLDAHTRKLHGQIARRAAIDTLDQRGIAARRTGVTARQLDVSVIGWRVASADGHTAVTAEIRIVMCDGQGRMLSIVNGKATIRGRDSQLAALREQAIAEGVGHLVAHLGFQLDRADV